MREKVVPIPFLGRDVSGWLYRTSRRVHAHPIKTAGIILACVAGSILYEAQVTHKDRIPSPNVNNHLYYQLRRPSLWRRLTSHDASSQEQDDGLIPTDDTQVNASEMTTKVAAAQRTADSVALEAHARRTIEDTERLLAESSDPVQQAALQRIIAREREVLARSGDTTMMVRSGQLVVRAPHWDIRNQERNWSIMARDQQQQKDHYWYRLERSRDDDFARNTYSRP